MSQKCHSWELPHQVTLVEEQKHVFVAGVAPEVVLQVCAARSQRVTGI